jgi:parvulin-like peptidyl-prolyl isomerase
VLKPVRLPLVRLQLVCLGALLVLILAACGGNQSVPAGAVADVNGTEISRSDLDSWLAQAQKSYEAQKQKFPKVGTPEYQSIQAQYVAYLVQKAEFEQAAKDLGITVSKKDVDQGVSDYIKAKFGGSQAKFEKALKAQNFPESTFRQTIELSVLSQKIFDAVTKDVTVPEQDALAYYNQNIAAYQQKASRDVRHILIAKKKANGQVDYPKSERFAFRLYNQLKAGANFASLAKKYSADTQSAQQGGKLTIQQGQTVPEFDKVAFGLDTRQISTPIKTTFGYHIIQPLTKVKPGHTTPFAKVANSIRATLLQQKKQEAITTWGEDLAKKYKNKVHYATGFAPPEIPSTPTDTSGQ